MNNMIIFAGTTEGRMLAERFSKENIRIHISVYISSVAKCFQKLDILQIVHYFFTIIGKIIVGKFM